MTSRAAREAQWERLRAEHAAARVRLAATTRELDFRLKDPLGVKGFLKGHPFLSAGIGAAAAALLAKSLFGKGADAAPPTEEGGARTPEPSPVLRMLRDAAMSFGMPMIARAVGSMFSGRDDEEARV